MGSTRRISSVAGAVTVTGILANTLVAPVLPEIERAFDATPTELGAIVAFASLPGVALAPVIGVLADRFGRRTVLLPCLCLFGVGGLAGMLAPSLGWLLLGRFLQGSGAAGLVNLAIVILGDTFTGEARARAIGRNAAVLTAGLAVTPLVGGALSAIGGWRLSFAPYAIAFPIALAVRATLPPDRPFEVVPLRRQVAGAAPYLRSLGSLAMIGAGFCAFVLVFGLGITALPLHLDREFGLGAAGRGLVLGLPAVASVVVSLRMGQLTTRFGTWPLVIWGFVLFAAAFSSVAVAPLLVVVLVASLVWGAGEALTIVTLQAYATEIAPAAQRGTVVAAWVSGVRAGQAVGPVSAGGVISAAGTSAAFGFGAVFSAAVGGLLAAARSRTQGLRSRPAR